MDLEQQGKGVHSIGKVFTGFLAFYLWEDMQRLDNILNWFLSRGLFGNNKISAIVAQFIFRVKLNYKDNLLFKYFLNRNDYQPSELRSISNIFCGWLS